jgi:thioredoxin 1
MTLEVTDSNFKELLQSGEPLVVDFWAPWCGPCRMMSPIVDEMAELFDGKIRVGKLNVDENEEVPAEFGIMSIPTMLMFKDSKLVNTHVGACSKAALQEQLNALL